MLVSCTAPGPSIKKLREDHGISFKPEDADCVDWCRFYNQSKRCGGRNVWIGYAAPDFGKRMKDEKLSDEYCLERALGAFQGAF